MAGTLLVRELTGARTGRVRFEIAGWADDADIRRLLRATPTPGQISLSLEREPNYFADAGLPGETKQAVVARDGGLLICVGCCTIRKRFVNGAPRRTGYLSSLRLDARHAGRFDILRRGYEFFRELQSDNPADYYLTSIAVDNHRARKFLERGLVGMPLYECIGEFVTLLIPTSGCNRGKKTGNPDCAAAGEDGKGWDEGLAASSVANDLVAFLNECNTASQFAPCWSADELIALRGLGLQTSDFRLMRHCGRTVACGAVWDQRNFKQTVIQDYAPWLAIARPAFNAFARLTHQPRLPVVGETLANAFVSHLATRPDKTNLMTELVEQLRSLASWRGIELLTLGFAANDPRLAEARGRFRSREYRSRLYVVRWPGIGGAARELDDRCLAPEVALL
jgi:hypothetical protein